MDTSRIMTDLSQFTGTETWWKHPIFRSYTYTDGVKYVADSCKAYWLIDAILSNQIRRCAATFHKPTLNLRLLIARAAQSLYQRRQGAAHTSMVFQGIFM